MKLAQTHSTMTREQIWELAQSPRGRIALHLIALRIDGRLEWHLDGIVRELREMEFPHAQGLN
jgi:hypothetical protein